MNEGILEENGSKQITVNQNQKQTVEITWKHSEGRGLEECHSQRTKHKSGGEKERVTYLRSQRKWITERKL